MVMGSVMISRDHLGLSLSSGPFIPSVLIHLEVTELLEWEYLMTWMKTEDRVKGWGITTTLTIN